MADAVIEKVTEARVLARILAFYLDSRDFNGIAIEPLAASFGVTMRDLRRPLRALVRKGRVTLAFARHSENPHILRIAPPSPDDQLVRLDALLGGASDRACAYPTPATLRPVVDTASYDGCPHSLRLAVGEPQLTPVFFDLDVLERYLRDPRYEFRFEDYAGSIGMKTEAYEDPRTRHRDKVLLDTFGIAYTEHNGKRERVVVAYLRYLAHLPPEHQQIWRASQVDDSCTMNSDYERATVWGAWPLHHSAYAALLAEQVEINKLCAFIGKPALFRATYDDGARPAGFGPMLRPTRRNFHDFIHLLDKLVSENINQDFFRGDIPMEQERVREDGRVEVTRSGSLQLLEAWLTSRYRAANSSAEGSKKLVQDALAPFKKVRKLRQKPAHVVEQDEYSRSYPWQQDSLVGDVVRGLRMLRYILQSHPSARGRYAPPDWLDGDAIVFY